MKGTEESRYVHLTHDDFGPLFDRDSRTLILGSFPSVKSREQRFYYGHPQNRFWRILSALFQEEMPEPDDIPAKRSLALRHGIALWDVIEECDIVGSADSTIRNVKTTDLAVILDHSRVDRIFVNGGTAFRVYERYTLPRIGRPAEKLPSSSPANAAWSLGKLIEAWSVIRPSC
ncbi:DNA-deoxyinosine glycosylase [Lachnoclostridium sp. Marseille-P6806]|uniref:DNA-deoxyinosine glycosylase n=1 Tax=Lachnoclostridium sp. Marseille-P6806 TaxID=2364793 RepID=UPI00102F8E2A|nr:DNA-deoxyinosine glycosylase [Lachnoclostridium sp. Marseille-P6806]